MKTVGEYVQNEATRIAVKNIGVDFVQGYAIAKPKPLDALLTMRNSLMAEPKKVALS